MESDSIHAFSTELNFYLTKLKHSCPLIRKHKEHLRKYGDFSFPLNFEYWIRYIPVDKVTTRTNVQTTSGTILDYCFYNKNESRLCEGNNGCDAVHWVLEDIVKCSKSWSLVVSKCTVQHNRVQIYLDRKIAFQNIIERIISKNSSYGSCCPKQKLIAVTSCVTKKDKNEMDLSDLRIEFVRNTTVKLLQVAGFEVSHTCNKACTCLHFTNKSTDELQTSCQRVLCGVVINTKHRSKESSMKAREYIRQRCGDMQMVTECKYMSKMGEESSQWEDFLLQLGDASVKMDLLHVKPSHTVSLNVDSDSACSREASSRGASFVLYNCARISAIQSQFREKVESGYYPPLIPLQQVDFSLLCKEEEWELLFVYLLCYPSVLESSVHSVEEGKVSPNVLCRFIMDMSSCFSIYYRRVRVLTEARSHLLPVMFARLYLLQAIQQVLHNALGILGISPVLSM